MQQVCHRYSHFLDCSLLVAVYVMGTQASNKTLGIIKALWKSTAAAVLMLVVILVWKLYLPYEGLHLIANSGSSTGLFAGLLLLRDENTQDLTKQVLNKLGNVLVHSKIHWCHKKSYFATMMFEVIG